MSLSNVTAALDELADGKQPVQRELNAALEALTRRVQLDGGLLTVFDEASMLLRLALQSQVDSALLSPGVRSAAASLSDRIRTAELERYRLSAVSESVWSMVEIQHRRLVNELDVHADVSTITADFHFFVVALRRLRRCTAMLVGPLSIGVNLSRALADFDAAIPYLPRLVGLGEHLDGLALSSPECDFAVEVHSGGAVGRHVIQWRGTVADLDAAIEACGRLRRQILAALA